MIYTTTPAEADLTDRREATWTADFFSNPTASPMATAGSGWFTGKDGVRLLERWWLPESPKAAVVIIHGYAEHSGRYAHVAESFVAHGYAVYAYDHRAHGESGGENTFIESFDDFLADMDHFLNHIQPRLGELPFFLLGHSMGGLITAHYMTSRQPTVQGVILSGPFVATSEEIPEWLVSTSIVVGALLPKLPTLRLTYKYISHDSEILAIHQADKLIYRGRIPARTGAELNRAVKQLDGEMEAIDAPLLIVHGGVDKIAPVQGSQRLYEQASSKDKEIKIYDGLFHEILNEVEREAVKADIITWMDNRYER